MKSSEISMQGVLLTLASTTLFALASPYVKLLSPLSGGDIFAWRTIWTAPFLLALIVSRGRIPALRALIVAIHAEPRDAIALVTCAGLLGLQQWLFMWAPLHGKMRDVSLGYFLLPIVMVLVGRLVDRQRVHWLQWIAIGFATLGVLHEFIVDGGASWPLLIVAVGFPPYFLLRRRLKHDSLTVFAAEIAILLPFAAATACRSQSFDGVAGRAAMLVVLLLGLGFLSALSFALYLKASSMLPMGLFGLLGYMEPILLAAISVFIFREQLSPEAIWTFLPICLSVLATATYVIRSRPRRYPRKQQPNSSLTAG
jgi:chloramphenicol-sensitive protein RarD